MTKYQCPHCHKNEKISEIYICWVEDTGVLGEFGEIDNGNTQILDSPDYTQTHYFCYSCNKEFNDPEEVDEEAG
jgi:hypothetical protein